MEPQSTKENLPSISNSFLSFHVRSSSTLNEYADMLRTDASLQTPKSSNSGLIWPDERYNNQLSLSDSLLQILYHNPSLATNCSLPPIDIFGNSGADMEADDYDIDLPDSDYEDLELNEQRGDISSSEGCFSYESRQLGGSKSQINLDKSQRPSETSISSCQVQEADSSCVHDYDDFSYSDWYDDIEVASSSFEEDDIEPQTVIRPRIISLEEAMQRIDPFWKSRSRLK